MTSESVRHASDICDRAFGFLAEEYRYSKLEPTYENSGFSLRYRGSAVGVVVDWHPRDPLSVWLVRLDEGAFPVRVPIGPDVTLHYFDLGDLEVITGFLRRQVKELQLYNLPDETNAELLAGSLRRSGGDILSGNLTQFDLLQTRVKERTRDVILRDFGPEEARRRGW